MTPVKDEKVRTPSLSGAARGKLPISVEMLLRWTYADQRAHLMPASDGPAGAGSMFDGFSDGAALGWFIGGSSSSASRLHDDAYAVHDVVSRLPGRQREPVMVHGFMRTRPDPRLGARHRLEPEWLYETQPDGITVLRVATVERISRALARSLNCPDDVNRYWVPVHQADKAYDVSFDRARWSAWAEGLLTVHDHLTGKLVAHELSDEVPVTAPWAGGLDAK